MTRMKKETVLNLSYNIYRIKYVQMYVVINYKKW